jgi:hypothetical protein
MGPYAVTIDGILSHNFTVIEYQAGSQRVRVEYGHSMHDIAVAGAAVVPEFPVQAAVALAGMMGAAMLATRLRPYFAA